jgi:carboxyl-terminal processing protease
MTTRTRIVIILATAPLLAFVVVGGLLARTHAPAETYPHLRVFDEVFSLTTGGYVEAVDPARLMHGAMHGLAESLDADSAYLTPDEARAANGQGLLPAGDVGLALTRQYYLRVVAVLPGSPADRAGMRSGDYVRIIDRRATRDMSAWEGQRLMRGAVGSTLALTVLRGNAVDAHVVTLTRERIVEPEPTATMADGVGTIRLVALTPESAAAVKTRVAKLQRDGARAIVLDLRTCAGGTFDGAIAVAKTLVASGPLAQIETRGAQPETLSAAPGDGSLTLPVAVLVGAGTSGPAEVLAASLQHNKRAEIIGERTAGRTAIQKLFPLPDGSALWMSYAQYRAPAGAQIHERGVQPDVAVEEPEVEFGAAPKAGDPAMQKAVERLHARSGSQGSLS